MRRQALKEHLGKILDGLRKEFEELLANVATNYGNLVKRSLITGGRVDAWVRVGGLRGLMQVYGGLLILHLLPDVLVLIYPSRVRRRKNKLDVVLGLDCVSTFWSASFSGELRLSLVYGSVEEAEVFADYLRGFLRGGGG